MNKNFQVAFLATGNEITEGDILNTNTQEMAHILMEHGVSIGNHVMVSDDEEDIENALEFLLARHQVIIITGGLGPTSDDKTRYALSKFIKKEFIFDDVTWQHICDRYQKHLNKEAHPSNRQQALFPEGSKIIPNPHGSAAGCRVDYKDKIIFMLPGPPKECMTMFQENLLPELLTHHKTDERVKLSWKLLNAIEGEIAAQIDEALKTYPAVTGYRAASPYLEVKIYTEHHPQYDEMIAVIEKIIAPFLVKE
jgi:molybdenum cofactor synthesis domain-containing protein